VQPSELQQEFSMQDSHSGPNDEIDFRALVRSLLRAKWWLIGVTVGAAVVAFVLGQLTASKGYQSRAMVVFGQAPLNINVLSSASANFNPGNSALPDTKGITDLATVDDIFMSVYQSPELDASREDGLTFGKIKQESSVSVSGTNQLILRVTDPDPKRAPLLVNLWAQAVADRLNTLYGSSSAQVSGLQGQLQSAQQSWDKAEKALIDYLPQSKIDSLSAQLMQTQLAYNGQLAKIHAIDLLLSDARALDARLAVQQATSAVRSGDALSLLQLHQRASEQLVCSLTPVTYVQTAPEAVNAPSTDQTINCSAPTSVQLQFSGVPEGTSTVGDVQQDLKLLMDSLQSQQTELKNGLTQMESELTLQRSQLESAQYQLDQLTTERDFAKTTYGALAAQIGSAQAEIAAKGTVARVVGEAGPATLIPNNVVSNAILAGITAFFLVAVCVLALEWWRSESKEE
jgi:uncharacterized protein involved in exopolysaccharide biosynthesis